MISFRPIVFAAAILTAVALVAAGCGPTKGTAQSKKVGAKEQTEPAGSKESLAWLGKKPLGEYRELLLALDSGDQLQCWHAEEALGEMGPGAAPYARMALAANTPEARAAACRLAFKFHDQAAIPAMIALLDDQPRMGRAEPSRLVMDVAGVCLRGLTEQDFDFRPDALPADRAAAKARWENWYASTYGPVTPPKR